MLVTLSPRVPRSSRALDTLQILGESLSILLILSGRVFDGNATLAGPPDHLATYRHVVFTLLVPRE